MSLGKCYHECVFVCCVCVCVCVCTHVLVWTGNYLSVPSTNRVHSGHKTLEKSRNSEYNFQALKSLGIRPGKVLESLFFFKVSLL